MQLINNINLAYIQLYALLSPFYILIYMYLEMMHG